MLLRPYQQELIDKIKLELKNGSQSVCVVLGCGGGKSIIQGMIAKSATSKNNRVLFLVHRNELCEQITNTFTACGVDYDYCEIGMVQTVTRRLKTTAEPKIIITDECFPAGTRIDGIPIENLKPGDYVSSFNHDTGTIEVNKIERIFKNTISSKLIKINRDLICTENHPIFSYTKGDYIEARDVKQGEYILHRMQEKVNMGRINQKSKIGLVAVKKAKSILQQRMYKGKSKKKILNYNGKNKSNVCFRENEEKQPYEKSANKKKSIKYIKRNRTQTTCNYGKRSRNDNTTRKIAKCFKKIQPCIGICNKNKGVQRILWKIPRQLQNRYCYSKQKDSNRSRWKYSQSISDKRERQEENRIIRISRVESVEVLERGSDGKYGGVSYGDYVYNIEVDKNHNYFANGYLVHNCHHSLSATYKRIYDYFPNAVRLGFTATPIRLNEGGLGEVYEELVTGVSTKWLVDNNYLAPYRYYSVKLADTSKLHTKMGDYVSSEIAELMENKYIYGDTVENYRKIADGKKALVYCSSIKSSQATAAEFKQAGYTAAHIDGTTPAAERKRLMTEFKNDKINILCNVDLFGEGLDVPDCECAILLRPTKSLTLYVQQSMRSMRYKKNKTAIIIDHVGNVFSHGLPDDEREWTLETKKKKQINSVSVRECKNCFGVFKSGLNICPYCGYEHKTEERKEKQVVKTELQEITSVSKPSNLSTWDELVAYQKYKKYHFGWVIRQARSRNIEIPKKYTYYARRFCS